MVKRFLKPLSSLFKKEREYFFVIEELDRGLDVTTAQVDHAEKKIHLTGKRSAKNFHAVRRPVFYFDRLVLALDSTHATTIESTVRVKRARADQAIDESELDALVFKGLWEFLNRYRSWVAKKMGTSDLDLVLAHIEIKDVRIGVHRLLNPLGFKGPDLTVRFKGTFVPRAFIEVLERFREWSDDFVVVERGSALAGAVAEADDTVVTAGDMRSTMFTTKENESLYLKEFMWGFDSVRHALAEQLGVTDEVAGAILERSNNDGASERFQRFIDREVRNKVDELTELISRTRTKGGKQPKSTTHIHFRFSLPNQASLVREPHMRLVNTDGLPPLKDFTVTTGKRAPSFHSGKHHETLALLVYPYTHPHYAFLNQLLRRRVKWLIPHPVEK